MQNPLNDLDFSQKAMLFLVVFIVGIFLWDVINNNVLDKVTVNEILKSIGKIFTNQIGGN
jgi:hypothetical protein